MNRWRNVEIRGIGLRRLPRCNDTMHETCYSDQLPVPVLDVLYVVDLHRHPWSRGANEIQQSLTHQFEMFCIPFNVVVRPSLARVELKGRLGRFVNHRVDQRLECCSDIVTTDVSQLQSKTRDGCNTHYPYVLAKCVNSRVVMLFALNSSDS